jgi:prevent-host-death family protein
VKGVTNVNITNISEAETHLSVLIERVLAGEEVIIGKAGKPVAKLVPYDRGHELRQPGALRGKITIRDDFDELPEDIAEAFGALQP